jgi:hypothetical protein
MLRSVPGRALGVAYRMPNHLVLRPDFRDYISPFVHKIVVPAADATVFGLLQQSLP